MSDAYPSNTGTRLNVRVHCRQAGMATGIRPSTADTSRDVTETHAFALLQEVRQSVQVASGLELESVAHLCV